MDGIGGGARASAEVRARGRDPDRRSACGPGRGVVSVGHNLRVQTGDPTAHAEIGVHPERGAAAGLAHADAGEHAEPVRDVLGDGGAAPGTPHRHRENVTFRGREAGWRHGRFGTGAWGRSGASR